MARRPLLPALMIAATLLSAEAAHGRDIVDMSGRTVNMPDDIHRVYGAFTSSVAIMAAIAPDLLAGTYADHSPELDRLLPPVMAALPRLEANAIQTMDLEKVVAADIDMALSLNSPGLPDKLRGEMTKIGKPTIAVNVERLSDYPATFRFLGPLFHREQRAEALATYIETSLARLKAASDAIPPARRIRVYYADSPDGLHSQCDTAFRAEVIPLAGAINALHCDTANQLGSTPQVTAEQLIALNPQVILTRMPQAARMFLTDPRWRQVEAVRSRRIHMVPSLPFNWFDRPPSYMRVMGAQWLASLLYPDRFPIDMGEESRHFFSLFFGVSLTGGEVSGLLGTEATP